MEPAARMARALPGWKASAVPRHSKAACNTECAHVERLLDDHLMVSGLYVEESQCGV